MSGTATSVSGYSSAISSSDTLSSAIRNDYIPKSFIGLACLRNAQEIGLPAEVLTCVVPVGNVVCKHQAFGILCTTREYGGSVPEGRMFQGKCLSNEGGVRLK
jgi:hypothetical protein